jgi:hypothetical protein
MGNCYAPQVSQNKMKIEFDKIAPPYRFPLSATNVKKILAECVPPEILPKLARVHFGCNQQTAQEARIVGRGTKFDVRINFCPKEGRTKLLTENREWCNLVEYVGGSIDKKGQFVLWTHEAAKKYAAFLIVHEVAHIVYAQRHGFAKLNGPKTFPAEESWCNAFAKSMLSKLTNDT